MPRSVIDRRETAREKIFEVTILALDGVEHRAHLLDRSARGARAHSRHPFAIGQKVTVRSPDIDQRAAVCWTCDDGRLGLQFL